MKTIRNTSDILILQHRSNARALVPLLALAIVACVFMIGRSEADEASALVLIFFGLILALGTVWQTQTARLIIDIPKSKVKLRRRSLVHLQRLDWPLADFGGVLAKNIDGNRFQLILLVGSPARYAQHPMSNSSLNIKTAQDAAETISMWLKAHRIQDRHAFTPLHR